MGLSYEEAMHEAVTNVLKGSYNVLQGPTNECLKIVIETAQEALEDFVVNITNGKETLQDIIG